MVWSSLWRLKTTKKYNSSNGWRTYDKEHIQDLVAVSSPFHAKISKNNITNFEFKFIIYYFTAWPSFWPINIKIIWTKKVIMTISIQNFSQIWPFLEALFWKFWSLRGYCTKTTKRKNVQFCFKKSPWVWTLRTGIHFSQLIYKNGVMADFDWKPERPFYIDLKKNLHKKFTQPKLSIIFLTWQFFKKTIWFSDTKMELVL